MIEWRASLERAVETLELPGLAGLVAIALALVAWTAWVHPLEARRTELVAHAARPAQAASSRPAGARTGEGARGPSASAFYATFPPLDSNVRWLAAIQQASIESGVALDSGAYRLEHPSDLRLARYHMMLPVSGSYAQIRAFIAATLAAVPAASLDDLQLARPTSDSSRLDARLSLSLYLREAP